MARKTKKRYKMPLILAGLILLLLSGITIGFARYNRILQLGGDVSLKSQGDVYISDVTFTGGQNVTSNPSFTDTTVDFSLDFYGGEDVTEYSANFSITVTNETFYDQIFSMNDWQPTITDGDGNVVADVDIDYVLTGIQNGDTIAKGTSKTFTVAITMTAPPGEYHVDGSTGVDFTDSNTGVVLAAVSNPTTGDLRGSNQYAAFTVHVTNTYDYAQTFSLELQGNSHFQLSGANGASLGTFTIDANSAADYVVYVSVVDGVTFSNSYERANIYLSSAALGDINCGRITLLVDQVVIPTDTEAPVISNVRMQMLDSVGQAKVTWDATDESQIDHFVVLVYTSGNVLKQTITTEDDTTELTISGLGDGNYYVKVYGFDTATPQNSATEDEIADATTSAGHCARSATTYFDWHFTVTYDLTGLSTNGASTATRGTTYTATLSTTSNRTALPTSITVVMGTSTLRAGTDYTYSSDSGAISIPNVSGDITIRGEARSCLIEGTDILLADGSTKKVEDINYDDLLAVWNYDTGRLDAAYPIWIEREHHTKSYQWAHFADGSDLRTLAEHGIFSVEQNQFISVKSADFLPGTHYYRVNAAGELDSVALESVANITESRSYYHVVTARYYNVIANGFITTDGTVALSNLYGFADNISWPAVRTQLLADSANVVDYDALADIVPQYMYVGMRMGEIGVLTRMGALSLTDFRNYLLGSQLNPLMAARPELMNFDPSHLRSPEIYQNRRLWPVSFGALDAAAERAEAPQDSAWSVVVSSQRMVAEGQQIILPEQSGVAAWHNSVDGQDYPPSVTATIYCGTHFTPLRSSPLVK